MTSDSDQKTLNEIYTIIIPITKILQIQLR